MNSPCLRDSVVKAAHDISPTPLRYNDRTVFGAKFMQKLIVTILVAWLLVASAPVSTANAADKPAAPPPTLKVGDVAPDFTLRYFDGNDLKPVTLSQYRGKKNVVLAFYIFAFTGG